MLNPDVVGRTFPGANVFAVTQENISEFAAAIGEKNVTVAPPTFTIKISLTESQEMLEQSGLNWDRVVHGEQKFKLIRPIVAGDSIVCDNTVETARVAAGNEIVTVRSDLKSGTELVAQSWCTLVVRA